MCNLNEEGKDLILKQGSIQLTLFCTGYLTDAFYTKRGAATMLFHVTPKPKVMKTPHLNAGWLLLSKLFPRVKS